MFTKTPKVYTHGKRSMSVTPVTGKEMNGMKLLKQASTKVTQNRGAGESQATFKGDWKSKPNSKK